MLTSVGMHHPAQCLRSKVSWWVKILPTVDSGIFNFDNTFKNIFHPTVLRHVWFCGRLINILGRSDSYPVLNWTCSGHVGVKSINRCPQWVLVASSKFLKKYLEPWQIWWANMFICNLSHVLLNSLMCFLGECQCSYIVLVCELSPDDTSPASGWISSIALPRAPGNFSTLLRLCWKTAFLERQIRMHHPGGFGLPVQPGLQVPSPDISQKYMKWAVVYGKYFYYCQLDFFLFPWLQKCYYYKKLRILIAKG